MTTYAIIDESGETRLRGTIVPAPGGGSPPFVTIKGQLNNAQILALKDTDVEVIDAPGVGLAVALAAVSVVLDQRNGAYTYDDGGEIDLGSGDYWTTVASLGFGWFESVTTAVLAQRYVNSVSGGTALYPTGILDGGNPSFPAAALSLIGNLPVCFGNLGPAAVAGGGTGNTLSYEITYRVVSVVPFTS